MVLFFSLHCILMIVGACLAPLTSYSSQPNTWNANFPFLAAAPVFSFSASIASSAMPLFAILLCSAFAACFAEFCTIPLDVAKVRLQLQKKAPPGEETASRYRGLLGTVATIAREEGLCALWHGLVPGLHRQCIYGGLRIGLYAPVKYFLGGSEFMEDTSIFLKVTAALLTGALAIAVANPTDLVKVRLQAQGKLPAGVSSRYSGALNAYITIVRQEGLGALWTGFGPNMARNAVINAAELASYDQIKETILKIPGSVDNVFTHLLAGLGAGFFAVCVGSPVDVVKSRMMGDSTYKSSIDCFMKTWKNEGVLAFYKGFAPNFGRLGSWNVVMFLTFEQDHHEKTTDYLSMHDNGRIDNIAAARCKILVWDPTHVLLNTSGVQAEAQKL